MTMVYTMDIEDIKIKLKETLTPKRFRHSLNVMESAVELAYKYGENPEGIAFAGLLHDCARDVSVDETFRLCNHYGIEIDEISRLQPELLHGRLGARLAKELYGIESVQVHEAIELHTMGLPGMNRFCKIIFVADSIEPGRTYPEAVSIRNAAMENLDSAVLLAMDSAIKYVIRKNRLIHPDLIVARNWILRYKNGEK